MTVNGATLRDGDLFGSGTISGPEKGTRGCFLELTWSGTEPLTLDDGSQRTFLEDGDTVTLRATRAGAGRQRHRARRVRRDGAARRADGGRRVSAWGWRSTTTVSATLSCRACRLASQSSQAGSRRLSTGANSPTMGTRPSRRCRRSMAWRLRAVDHA